MTQQDEREIQLALVAADDAIGCLERAGEALKNARNWGLFDVVAGGWLSTMFKHGKMKDAQAELNGAARAIKILSQQLRDVEDLDGIDLNTDDFLGIADYLFDGFLADLMMQSRISNAQEKVARVYRQILQIRSNLEDLLEERT